MRANRFVVRRLPLLVLILGTALLLTACPKGGY